MAGSRLIMVERFELKRKSRIVSMVTRIQKLLGGKGCKKSQGWLIHGLTQLTIAVVVVEHTMTGWFRDGVNDCHDLPHQGGLPAFTAKLPLRVSLSFSLTVCVCVCLHLSLVEPQLKLHSHHNNNDNHPLPFSLMPFYPTLIRPCPGNPISKGLFALNGLARLTS